MGGPPHQGSSLGYRKIFLFYYPLALSWLLMAVESPLSVRIIAGAADFEVNVAAFGLIMGLSIWIESPVIDLLATSTTLAKCRQAFLQLRKFTLILMGLVTVFHAAVALSPLFDWITVGLLGVPQRVADVGRLAMIIMIPWSALIGWRRFLQGVLIRQGRTRLITFATIFRALSLLIVGFSLLALTELPGVVIAAIALVCSVAAEAVLVHVVSRSEVQRLMQIEQIDSPPPTLKKLWKFHSPLTASTLVMLTSPLLITRALAGTVDPLLALAAWPVATAILFPFRTITFALPEVVIALYKDADSARKLLRFCLAVGIFCTLAVVAFVISGFDKAFFINAQQATPTIAAAASLALLSSAALPVIGAAMGYVRGMLTAHHKTVHRFIAIIVAVAMLLVGLQVGTALGWPGVAVAGAALTFGHLCELLVLSIGWWHAKRRLTLATGAA